MISRRIAVFLFMVGVLVVIRPAYYYGKGCLAQILLERAWVRSLREGAPVKAWDWADTHPVGRLIIPCINLRQIILLGAHNEALAFGPGLVTGSSLPGEPGDIVLAGHRDSFFRNLREVTVGQSILVESAAGMDHFLVTDISIIDPSTVGISADAEGVRVTLITCYPFDLIGDAPMRFVVTGERAAL